MRPTMFGYILHYSVQTGAGAISGDDGARYSFAGRDWLSHEPPNRGDRVEFTVLDGRATGVSATVPAHRRNQGPQRGFGILAVAAGLAAGLLTFMLVIVMGRITYAIGLDGWSQFIDRIDLWVAIILAIAVGYLVFRAVGNRRR